MKRKGDDDLLGESERKRERRQLISMQIDDFIGEQKLGEVQRKALEALAESVKCAIYAADQAAVTHQMCDLQKLHSSNIQFPLLLPFGLDLSSIKSTRNCRWIHPVQVEILSSWRIGFHTNKEPILDLIIIIPQSYFGTRDYLNLAYFVKRAHYLCDVARIIKKLGLVVKFGLDRGDSLKPLLFVSDLKNEGFLRIHFAPPRDFTKLSRFRPENNNLRPSFCSARLASLGITTPTPVYNSKIVVDILRQELESKFENFFFERPNFSKALFMVRSWMLRRSFIQRADGFSDLLLMAFFIFIHEQSNFVPQTSALDIILAFFSAIISTNWKQSRLGLYADVSESLYDQFAGHFDFVFLDYTGYFNLAASLSTVAMEQIRAASSDAIKRINSFNEFNLLFLENHPFTLAFDQYIRIQLPEEYMENVFQKMCDADCVNTCNDLLDIFRRKSNPLLKQGLSERVIQFDFFIPSQQDSQWDIHEKPMKHDFSLFIGFRLSSKWNNLLTRGPPAKSPEAAHFRQFWGEICELRKLPDNCICEAVAWPSSNVPLLICKHILQRHLKLEPLNVEERMLKTEEILPNMLDRYSIIGRAYEKLSKTLRMVNQLPLLITNIHPISAYLRRTMPFAPRSSCNAIERHSSEVQHLKAYPISDISPPYLPSVKVQILMEQSGKWGEELGTIARLKTAFYIELAKVLNEEHSMQTIPFQDSLIIHFDSVVFRLSIAYPKEVHIMRKLNGGKTGIPKDSAASKAKELEVVFQPQLTALLHSVGQQFEAFADTCRLAAYWLSSHLLSDYVNEVLLETIVASVFLKPFSIQQPRTPFIAFYHFLTLLYTHNWLLKPLFVDFNNEWTEEFTDELEKEFIKMRPVLPAMVVYTSVDLSGCRFTREEPQPLILKRIIALAQAATTIIEQHIIGVLPVNLKGIFTTEVTRIYDVLIHLKGHHMVRRRVTSKKIIQGPLPVIDYDPVKDYVKCLKRCFSSVALFFYNENESNVIGVLWKPVALTPRDASVSSCLHRLQHIDNKLHINRRALLEDFAILGHGIVREIVENRVKDEMENV